MVEHIGPVVSAEPLSAPYGLAALAALGHPTRLEIFFRLLMRHEPDGLPAGAMPPSSAARRKRCLLTSQSPARAQLTHGTRAAARSFIVRISKGCTLS